MSSQGCGGSNQINDNSKNAAAPERPGGQSGVPAFTRPAKINSLEILLLSKFPTKTLYITDLKKYIYSVADTQINEPEDLGRLSISSNMLFTIRTRHAGNEPSGPTVDTKSFIRGCLVQDALYQLIRGKKHDSCFMGVQRCEIGSSKCG